VWTNGDHADMTFTLRSTAFSDGGAIPRRFTCDGDDVSPDLDWTGAPPDTAAFALIFDDPDASGFVHWLVYNMTGSATGGLPEAISATPDAPTQGINDFGRLGYRGPCPPNGEHHYRLTLYALDGVLPLPAAPRAGHLRAALEGHVLAEAVLTGTCRRG
jgi:Raf kinase inhibitor-like YbhB/YbcL family protein